MKLATPTPVSSLPAANLSLLSPAHRKNASVPTSRTLAGTVTSSTQLLENQWFPIRTGPSGIDTTRRRRSTQIDTSSPVRITGHTLTFGSRPAQDTRA